MKNDDKDQGKSSEESFDLDAFFENFDYEAAQEQLEGNSAESSTPDALLGQTMSYSAVGVDAPEIPFAGVDDELLPEVKTSAKIAKKPASSGVGSQKKALSSISTRTSRTASPRMSGQSAYLPLDQRSNAYHIRGGGASKRKRSPVVIVFSGLVVIIGIAIIAYVLNTAFGKLTVTQNNSPITLSQSETRHALDSTMPVILDNINEDFDEIVNSLNENGCFLVSNDHFIVEVPDPSAGGRQLIRMPVEVSDNFMNGWWEGGYNAYSITELQDYFNGTWIIEMSRGDMGSLFKIKYVNLNADSLEAEMQHLLEQQGLTGEGVTIAVRGVDSRGNIVIQGAKAIDDVVYYWKVAACPFNEVYSAKKLPANAIYVSCTIATYDFYTGSDDIKPA